MDIVHPRIAGIDVHEKVVWVAVRLPGEAPGERKVVIKRFRRGHHPGPAGPVQPALGQAKHQVPV